MGLAEIKWDDLLKSAVNAALQAAGTKAGIAAKYIAAVEEEHGDRLKLLADLYEKGNLNQTRLKEKLDQEADTYRLQLESIKFQNEAIVQAVLNSFMKNFYEGVLGAVKLA
ncbi:hypothetical protein [Paraburkholderia phytofirmans]|uniref:hypothetical protein n=1 Tax=Paraburkholderia phytofirmans TaxID=261302 RepID=UPI0038B9CD92